MNYIDTRELYKRKCDLESLRDEVTEAREALAEHMKEETPGDDRKHELLEALTDAVEQFGADEEAELAELEDLESEITDFMHGETMIPKHMFKDYAMELADDIADVADSWPCNCIDWERAARELAYDYTIVTYQGDDYYIRA